MSKELLDDVQNDLSWIQSRIYDNEQESKKLSQMADDMFRDYQNNRQIGQQPDPMLTIINSQLWMLTDSVSLVLNYLKLLGMKAGIPFIEKEVNESQE